MACLCSSLPKRSPCCSTQIPCNHLDGVERADLDANLAAHAGKPEMSMSKVAGYNCGLPDVIRFLVLALLDINALGRTFLLANLAGHAAQTGLCQSLPSKTRNGKLPHRFLQGLALFGTLDGRQPLLGNVASDEILAVTAMPLMMPSPSITPVQSSKFQFVPEKMRWQSSAMPKLCKPPECWNSFNVQLLQLR